MPKFAVRRVDAINCSLIINELVIDGQGQLALFEDSLEKQYQTQLETIYALIQHAANGGTLPRAKMVVLDKLKTDRFKAFEYKSKHLRVYAIKTENGQLLVLGGYKNTQKKDIPRFRSIANRYLDSINPI